MQNFFMPATLTKSFRTILVDLLPMLPGGENGGAKIFIIELLRTLSRLMPDTQFVLLTRRSSHNELAALDCANVTRRLILEDIVAVGQPVPNDRSFSRSTFFAQHVRFCRGCTTCCGTDEHRFTQRSRGDGTQINW